MLFIVKSTALDIVQRSCLWHAKGMNASRTARERARAELTREIKDEARRQLATSGADGLSLRAVARELGMVSSALYRYFPSRDELLTALIIDAYDALGEAAESASKGMPGRDFRGRWLAACRAVRNWAVSHPHEYALIYGSPVPGYQAPRDTVGPAARVPLVLIGIVRDAHATGALSVSMDVLGGFLAGQLSALAATAAPGVPASTLARAATAWTQLFGMVSFELFGQLAGTFEPAGELFDFAAERMAALAGL
jgi:AcrR family transcriptional regulator